MTFIKWMEIVKERLSKERLRRQYHCKRDITVSNVFLYFRETALVDGVSIEYGHVDLLWNKSVKEAFPKEWSMEHPNDVDKQLQLNLNLEVL